MKMPDYFKETYSTSGQRQVVRRETNAHYFILIADQKAHLNYPAPLWCMVHPLPLGPPRTPENSNFNTSKVILEKKIYWFNGGKNIQPWSMHSPWKAYQNLYHGLDVYDNFPEIYKKFPVCHPWRNSLPKMVELGKQLYKHIKVSNHKDAKDGLNQPDKSSALHLAIHTKQKSKKHV